MFTGIIEEVGRLTPGSSGILMVTASQVLRETHLGDSIAVNGVCLTITKLSTSSFSVDVMPETLQRTNLGLLKPGDEVNLERPLTLGGRLGGHLVQGHIDSTGKISAIRQEDGARIIQFEAAPEIMRYIVEKGFIAVDGASLTVVARDTGKFSVSIVEYTWQHTTLGSRRPGNLVNLEVDIIAKYVEQLSGAQNSGINMDFLNKHGFVVS